MKYKDLISISKLHFEEYPNTIYYKFSINIFTQGAKWMFDKLCEINETKKMEFDETINFNTYGLIKYGISLVATLISIILLFKVNIILTPLSILIFYFFEVHFLFLFPLLIDKTKSPICTSIKQTYKLGLFQSMFTVIPIGIFMIIGLIKLNNPLRNWYIGCYSILIWYEKEVRNTL